MMDVTTVMVVVVSGLHVQVVAVPVNRRRVVVVVSAIETPVVP